VKLRDLGVRLKPAQNEVRARLSELRKQNLVREEWKGGQAWSVTEHGELEIAEVTPQLRDDDLELFAK
jgi:hypothetical protein